MDFSSFKAQTKVNPVIVAEVTEKSNKPKGKLMIDISSFKKVYQSCDKCNTQTVQYIMIDKMYCIHCNSNYKIN